MSSFRSELERRLNDLRLRELHRTLRQLDSAQSTRVSVQRPEGPATELINFSSNDYLGLANDPLLKRAAIQATERYGTGSGASRLICGSIPPHRQLEEALAAFKRTEAALTFSSGYATAVGTICALVEKQDVIVLDKLVHASIVDAARLSGATIRVFPHNNLDRLETILKWARAGSSRSTVRNILLVTESVFSMEGDRAPLESLVALKENYGAWLMVDEAHAIGLFGPRGSGLAELTGLGPLIDIQMGTLGKALGSAGGFISGPRALIDLLINRARSFVFSTAPVPAAAAAATAAIEFIQSSAGAERRARLWANVRQFCSRLTGEPRESAIVPIRIGPEAEAMRVSRELQELGFLVPAVRYPTVSKGRAMLRVTLCASHVHAEIQALNDSLRKVVPQRTQTKLLHEDPD